MNFQVEDLPEIIKQGLQVDLINLNASGQIDVGQMDVDGVVNLLLEVRANPTEVIARFLKIMQGLNSLVYQYSNAFDEKSLEKKTLESELQSLYSKKDSSNPLYSNGQKLTNANIEAEIHKNSAYQALDSSIKKYSNYKSFLLTTYSIVNKTFEAATVVLNMRDHKGLSDSIRDRVKELADSGE